MSVWGTDRYRLPLPKYRHNFEGHEDCSRDVDAAQDSLGRTNVNQCVVSKRIFQRHTYLAQYAVQLLQHSGPDQVDKAHMDVAEIDRASIKLCINIDLIGFHLLHSVVDRRIWIYGIEARHHVEDSSLSSTISNYFFHVQLFHLFHHSPSHSPSLLSFFLIDPAIFITLTLQDPRADHVSPAAPKASILASSAITASSLPFFCFSLLLFMLVCVAFNLQLDQAYCHHPSISCLPDQGHVQFVVSPLLVRTHKQTL